MISASNPVRYTTKAAADTRCRRGRATTCTSRSVNAGSSGAELVALQGREHNASHAVHGHSLQKAGRREEASPMHRQEQ
jgi:hypothetical protein